MELSEIAALLADRAGHAGIELADPLANQLTVYFQLLLHWNRKINLTSLSDQDEAIDRLLLEPIAAAPHLPQGSAVIDLGSGGGSPAIPLALASGAKSLMMVESRSRKAAFLRECVRELGLPAAVESERFETIAQAQEHTGAFDVVSVRAVRVDTAVFGVIATLLRVGGCAALFRTPESPDPPPGLPAALHWRDTIPLLPSSRSTLTLLDRR